MSKEYETFLENGAYDISSRIFSFKELKRSVIEHGKNCFIEGYKNHKQLFRNYLIKQGYFSKEEILKIYGDFETYLMQGPELSLETAEKYLKLCDIGVYDRDTCKWVKNSNPELTDIQKDVIEIYKDLTNEKNILRIQKPRQGGVTTALHLIAYMESLNQKRVLYYGYEQKALFTSQYLTYKQLNSISGLSETKLTDKRYDLIIIDEVIEFRNPILDLGLAKKHLTENGRIIVSCTPLGNEEKQYNTVKDFLTMVCPDVVSYKWKCTDKNIAQAEKYPEFKNEILGEFVE